MLRRVLWAAARPGPPSHPSPAPSHSCPSGPSAGLPPALVAPEGVAIARGERLMAADGGEERCQRALTMAALRGEKGGCFRPAAEGQNVSAAICAAPWRPGGSRPPAR